MRENLKNFVLKNKSEGIILNVTERFRCHSLACGQAGCPGSRVADLDAFGKNSRYSVWLDV
jgi:hypothetical protein